jgi:hypothetical protein
LAQAKGWKPAAARFHPILLLAFMLAAPGPAASAADAVPELLRQVYWGETSQGLLQQFDGAATQLPRSLDFGDSYVDVVLHGETVGGVPVVTFFQMDKGSRGLKRIQLERPRHGVNPPALRAIAAALQADYGRPDKICLTPVTPISGYQAAAQEIWVRGTDMISAIYRDTTLQAFGGLPLWNCVGILRTDRTVVGADQSGRRHRRAGPLFSDGAWWPVRRLTHPATVKPEVE